MRDYDPMTGRYLQADPLGLVDGASVYGYVRQNPGRYVDPRGERGIGVGALGGSFGIVQPPVGWGVVPQTGSDNIIPFPQPVLPEHPHKPGSEYLPDTDGQCDPNEDCELAASADANQVEAAQLYPKGTNLGICLYWCPRSEVYRKMNMSPVIMKTMGCPPKINVAKIVSSPVSQGAARRIISASGLSVPKPRPGLGLVD